MKACRCRSRQPGPSVVNRLRLCTGTCTATSGFPGSAGSAISYLQATTARLPEPQLAQLARFFSPRMAHRTFGCDVSGSMRRDGALCVPGVWHRPSGRTCSHNGFTGGSSLSSCQSVRRARSPLCRVDGGARALASLFATSPLCLVASLLSRKHAPPITLCVTSLPLFFPRTFSLFCVFFFWFPDRLLCAVCVCEFLCACARPASVAAAPSRWSRGSARTNVSGAGRGAGARRRQALFFSLSLTGREYTKRVMQLPHKASSRHSPPKCNLVTGRQAECRKEKKRRRLTCVVGKGDEEAPSATLYVPRVAFHCGGHAVSSVCTWGGRVMGPMVRRAPVMSTWARAACEDAGSAVAAQCMLR